MTWTKTKPSSKASNQHRNRVEEDTISCQAS